MSAREFDRVDDWESRPFEGGQDLRNLAAQEFSGAVRAGGTWLFLLNGRVVGEFGGTVDSVADASGTVYTAPHPSVPLLLAMREIGGETRASYYTNETPLSEVDDTLASSGFTGYVELSENVHSGDYYVLYYGGRSMSVAFIGQREELVTGEEAFDRACEEVGIFEVVATDLDVKDVTEGDAGGTAAGAAGAAGAAAAGDDRPEADAEGASAPEQDGTPSTETAPADAASAGAGAEGADAAPAESAVEEPGSTDSDTPAVDSPGDAPSAEGSPDTTDQPAAGEAATTDQPSGSGAGTEAAADRSEGEPADGRSPEDAPEAEADPADDDKFSREEAWRETKTIPALDPEETKPDGDGQSPATAEDDAEADPAESPRGTGGETAPTRQAGEGASDGGEATDRRRQLRLALEERTEELETLRRRVDELAEEREELRAERDRLADRVETLERELAAAEEDTGEAAPGGGPALDPERALAETNLFVQYESQGGKATLEDAHAGDAEADPVNENLRLEYHTQFDAGGATVDGDPFESFLTGTPEYRFVEWLVRELLYEIRDGGHGSGLGELYDAIPEIYRVELRGEIEVPIDEEEGGVDTRGFDVVVRDRMGDPLVVADLNDSRDPVTGEMMETLLSAADEAAHAADLAAAFYVTASFFAPASLETATDATSGGLLSRNSLESFVNTGRKTGYHLCLVESRDDSFYLTVPEL